jgi:hypothetical protein
MLETYWVSVRCSRLLNVWIVLSIQVLQLATSVTAVELWITNDAEAALSR